MHLRGWETRKAAIYNWFLFIHSLSTLNKAGAFTCAYHYSDADERLRAIFKKDLS